jgi:hypothetical protein
VCIVVRKDQSFTKTDTLLHCAEQTLEVCAVELETESSNLRILALYRTPSANFNQFVERLVATLKYLYNPKSEFLNCGDINVACLNNNNNQKIQLSSLLTTYNLSHTVHFAARTQNDSSTAVLQYCRYYKTKLIVYMSHNNGLSDHDAEFLTINNIAPATNIVHLK